MRLRKRSGGALGPVIIISIGSLGNTTGTHRSSGIGIDMSILGSGNIINGTGGTAVGMGGVDVCRGVRDSMAAPVLAAGGGIDIVADDDLLLPAKLCDLGIGCGADGMV